MKRFYNERPFCEKCSVEAVMDKTRRPARIGFGGDLKVRIPYVCPEHGEKYLAEWFYDRMPEEERAFLEKYGG